MNQIRLGYACVNLSLGKAVRTSRTCRLSNASPARLETLAHENLSDLASVLSWNVRKGIRFYRISSGIIPFASHPTARWPWKKELRPDLLRIGEIVRINRLRVSMHPGQYTVLNSPHRSIVVAARAELEYHAQFLDQLDLDETHKIILHVGGVYGDRVTSMSRFLIRFRSLPANVQSRLVLENDDRNYGAEDVLALSENLGVSAVFDHLHHIAREKKPPAKKLLTRFCKRWSRRDGRPEFHFSTQRADSRVGSHADMIDTKGFIRFMQLVPAADIDVMLEAKSKDMALLSLRRSLLAYHRSLKQWIIT